MSDADSVAARVGEVAEAGRLRVLDGRRLRFWMDGATLRMTIENERTVLKTVVLRVFPLTRPEEWFTIRDGASEEIGVFRSLDELDSDSRKAVEYELARRYFMPSITRVVSAVERFGVVEWDAVTDRGRRSFMTRELREHVIKPALGKFIITDVDGNRYQIANVYALDSRSQALVMAHL